MANIRERMDKVEVALDNVWKGSVRPADLEDNLDGINHELRIVDDVFKERGKLNGPICCFETEDGKIGCGRKRPTPEGYVYIQDIFAPPEEFNQYCQNCRSDVKERLVSARERTNLAQDLHNLPLVEILGDLEKFHLAQQTLEPYHVPILTNEQLEAETQRTLPFAKSVPYHGGRFNEENAKPYFSSSENDKSCYLGLGHFRIAPSSRGKTSTYSEISHELNHMLMRGGAGEEVVMFLGMETDARMFLAGDKNHGTALYRILKNMASYSAYIKARWLGSVSQWEGKINQLFPAEIFNQIKEMYDKSFNQEFETKTFSIGSPDSYYLLVPYLALKAALRENRDYIAGGSYVYEKNIEIPALMKVVKNSVGWLGE